MCREEMGWECLEWVGLTMVWKKWPAVVNVAVLKECYM